MKKTGYIFLFVLLFIAIIAISACGSSSDSTQTASPAPTKTPTAKPTVTVTSSPTAQTTATVTSTPTSNIMQWSNPPAMSIDQNKQYTATMKTNFGDIVLELFPKDAPLAVNSFVFLARQGYYNGVVFHRVVKGFVIQSGDPTATGGGGPGYQFADEPVTRDYVQGTLAMANAGSDTNGSQFFICLTDLSGRLPKNYTIFGIVTSGMNIVQNIGNVSVKTNPNTWELSLPTVDVHIDTIVIEEK